LCTKLSMLSIAHGRYPTCQKVSGILPDSNVEIHDLWHKRYALIYLSHIILRYKGPKEWTGQNGSVKIGLGDLCMR
jgi:hypothetical protein